MYKSLAFLLLSLGSSLCSVQSISAQATPKQPTLELGVALGSQYLADYRGSDEYSGRAIPVPFFVYRGDKVSIDRRGVRGEILQTPRWEINASGEVSLGGANGDNRARRGMPELDSTFELGPSLNINLTGKSFEDGWLLRLPLRAVMSLDIDKVGYVGYLFNPKFTYIKEHSSGWRFATNIGATYGSNNYHDYFYSVDAPFVLPERPAYNAKAGFSGTYFKTSASRRTGSWRYGISLRYDNVANSVFEDSPLVDTDHYFAVSFLLAKYLWASDN